MNIETARERERERERVSGRLTVLVQANLLGLRSLSFID